MIQENNLTYNEYIDIIATVGWKCPSKRLLKKSLKNSITAKYIMNNETVGMARMITNHGYIAFIADVIVKPKHQGKGIGKKLINNLLERAKSTLQDEEAMMIQLLAANGKKMFYKQFGFKDKAEVVECGMYMWLEKDDCQY